jgi:PAS domain-containing protein
MNPAINPISFHASMLQAWSAFSDEFIGVWDDAGKDLLYFNSAYNQLFGYVNREDFIREYSFLGFRKHRLDLDIADLVLATIKTNGHWSEEVLFKKRDGDIFLGKLDITGFIFEGKTFYLQRVINIDTQRIFSENLFREIK